MIKINIQLFGGGTSAESYDEQYDPTPNNNMIDIKVGKNTYSFPQALFNNVGAYDGRKNAEKGYVAAVYAAYYAATGKDPYEVAKEALADKITTRPNPSAGYDGIPEGAVLTSGPTDTDYNEYILNNILKTWMEENGESFDVDSTYNVNNLNQLHDNNKSFQSGIKTASNTGAVKVNGQAYTAWKQTQPQFQEKPEGYLDDYGVPVAMKEDAQGNMTYVYKDPNTGMYVIPGASDNPRFNIGGLEGFTDMSGAPVRFNATGDVMVNTETGKIIVPDTTLPPYQPPVPIETSTNPREEAYNTYFNRYYDDVMTTEEGTMGKRILDNNISLYEKEAKNAEMLANTGLQAQAMAQAQAVKQVTDSVRSERMAQLRAGMSESQLADRELQMLMGSVNQMSQQAQMSSQEATAAQLAASTARENAFNDYITQATALGQNAAANYASQVGDPYRQAAQYMREAQENGQTLTWEEAWNKATGTPTN